MRKEEGKKAQKFVVILFLYFVPFVTMLLALVWAEKEDCINAAFFGLFSIVFAIVWGSFTIFFGIRLLTEEIKTLLQNHLDKEKSEDTTQV